MAHSQRLTREQSRALTRRRLMEAGQEVFAERGFHGASIEDIADRAGFSSGAFYSNFESKEELFLALFDERTAELVGAVTLLAEQNTSPADFFQALRQRSAGQPARPGWFLLSMEFVMFCLRNPGARRKLAARERVLRDAFGRIAVSQIEAAGLAPPASSEQLGLLFLALEQGIDLEEKIDPESVPGGASVDALELMFNALVALAREAK
jgi:AcrR family transcriptional regulator